MECLTIGVLPRSKSFWEKIQAYSLIRSQACCCILGSQSSIPDKSSKILSGPLLPYWNHSGKPVNTTWADICCTFSFLSNFCSLPTYIEGNILAAVTVPTPVHCSRAMSLPDKFLSTTYTLDPPGFNLEVFLRTKTHMHLGEGSTNTWTCFWCPMTWVSPLTTTVCKVGIFTSLVTTLSFSWSRSNSGSSTGADLEIIILIYANFQDWERDCSLFSDIQLVTWSIMWLPTWMGTLWW